ncbi:hypothetical protein [Methylocella sp. CPCC 101449]|uniref:hypothetical protein n=1 Tax=Methylocella sp. CPCC 101449 TaxID=2987531 RepID=UPI002891E2C5|nr:hypothetical protein [Methylocella sp. CPCC 101449]MDT2024561.1 hypothetical protein [Methylocella sp. CPCC 101449]
MTVIAPHGYLSLQDAVERLRAFKTKKRPSTTGPLHYPGGITWADPDYGERMDEVLRGVENGSDLFPGAVNYIYGDYDRSYEAERREIRSLLVQDILKAFLLLKTGKVSRKLPAEVWRPSSAVDSIDSGHLEYIDGNRCLSGDILIAATSFEAHLAGYRIDTEPQNVPPPPENDDLPRVAGRPSAMREMLAELDSRVQSGQIEKTLTQQADALLIWAADNGLTHVPGKTKSVIDAITRHYKGRASPWGKR